MNEVTAPFSESEVASLRGPKNRVDSLVPYGFFVENELNPKGQAEDAATILLTNRECPLRCTMCDLWLNTLDDSTPKGAVAAQLDYALQKLPQTKHIKLYNSGNFFDPQAIPHDDYEDIARRLSRYKTVIVESHPRFLGSATKRFRDLLDGELEIAIGLETIHPMALSWLNKRMTTTDYLNAVSWIRQEQMHCRTFLMIQSPGISPREAVSWTEKSVAFSFECGARVVSLIPTRTGNGAMQELQTRGLWSSPSLTTVEAAFDAALSHAESIRAGANGERRRLFLDLWDLEKFSQCPTCFGARRRRLQSMNHMQCVLPHVECQCGATN